ncbi:uncharacterized protein LOC131165250 [Malania oleifera]|uniref:uncharacterized protein LOC131165250 n=1 Tax=Malania oleifera TaxID=397392 RepID=UPI0025AE0465|nr:uncharacterized protein LOC131165250 [Malania oleifera]
MGSSEALTLENGNCHRDIPRRFEQNVIVMRHGDRLDNFEPLWASTAARPWDPPLVDAGLVRAFRTARQLHDRLPSPIRRVFVSPFLRCVQTASQAVSAVSVDDYSGIKVSIEYGLCEILNEIAIRIPPKDENWGFNVSELEAMFPAGTVDHTVKRIYKQLPQWEETILSARTRYKEVIQALADKFPSENLLLVTHGEGVAVAASAFMEDTTVCGVDYCACLQLRRTVLFGENQSFTAENFDVLTKNGETGISYCILSDTPFEV